MSFLGKWDLGSGDESGSVGRREPSGLVCSC